MDKFVANIEEIGYGGEGVCHNNGKVCFVKYSLPKEKLLVEKIEEKFKYDIGQIDTILEASKDRTTPLCPYFGVCGGCDFQHTNYKNELDIKKEILNKQLSRNGHNIDFSVVASDKDYFYRNKIRLFAGDKALGLKKEKTNQCVEISSCKIVDQRINKILPILNKFVYLQNLQFLINYIEIKTQNEKVLINIFLKKKTTYDFSILQNITDCELGLFETINNQTKHVFGLNNIFINESELNYIINPNSFRQINSFIANIIYKKIIENVENKTVVNCYSGAGVLSGMISLNGAKKVYGIELGENEHNDAEKLKENNNLINLINLKGDCAKILPLYAKKADLVVIDPPRNGCAKKVCLTLNNSNIKKIIYISCNHATFVRDVKLLSKYRIKEIELLDMFPKTANFEIYSVLEKI